MSYRAVGSMAVLFMVAALATAACGGTAIMDGASGAGLEGGGGMAGTGGTGGTAGSGGQPCSPISCAQPCPGEHWTGPDGCPICACAPPSVVFELDEQPAPAQYVTVDAHVAAETAGDGTPWWVFSLQWMYDDPAMDDEEAFFFAYFALRRDQPGWEPSAVGATWFYPQDAGQPLDAPDGEFSSPWFAAVLPAVDGWLTIRRVGNTFEGGVAMEYVDIYSQYLGTVFVSAPFTLAVPPGG